MSNNQQKGLGPKKVQPTRPKFAAQTGNIFGNNRLEVPDCYLAEAEEKGYECRWISSKDLKENHGSHKNMWAAYKFKSNPSNGIIGDERFAYGNDPEGIVRRGDLVLAVRTKDLGDQHRKHLADKRSLYNRYSEVSKKSFADFVNKESRGTMKVDEED